MNIDDLKLKLAKVVGNNNIIDNKNQTKKYSKDFHYPLLEGRIPEIVITPKTSGEIQKIIKIANKFKIPVIPKSSKVSRYGGTLPHEGGMIIDLQKMTRIISIDDSNMHVVIEPGVSYKQLQVELDKVNLRILPSIFSSSDSIISSYLARYPTFSMPKFEYNDLVVNLEIVLSNGDIFRTGSMASAKSAPVYPYGSSLDFFRLFHGARGSLGIVTKASIRVKPKPKIQEIISVPFQKHEDFINFVYEVERREIGTECLILNKFNALQYLNIENQGKNFPDWIFLICLEGPQRFPEEKVAYEKEALNEIIKKNLIQEYRNKLISQLEDFILKQFNGSDDNKRSQYYDIPLYLTLDKFPYVYKTIQSELKKFNDFNIDLGISIIPVERNRVTYAEFNLYTEIKEDKHLSEFRKLFRNLGELAIKSGAIVDIPYGPLKETFYSKIGNYSNLIHDIMNIFDPNRIMNPGKVERRPS